MATRIQAVWRGRLGRAARARRRGAVIRLHAAARRFYRKRIQRRRAAACRRIQSLVRGVAVRKNDSAAQLLREVKDLRRRVADADDLFKCPISQEVPSDPVFNLADGCIYEREQILRWIQYSPTSPWNRFYTSENTLQPLRMPHTLSTLHRPVAQYPTPGTPRFVPVTVTSPEAQGVIQMFRTLMRDSPTEPREVNGRLPPLPPDALPLGGLSADDVRTYGTAGTGPNRVMNNTTADLPGDLDQSRAAALNNVSVRSRHLVDYTYIDPETPLG
ncbi:MAG: U-box domain-containing protein [Pseudomonadota bacterium]